MRTGVFLGGAALAAVGLAVGCSAGDSKLVQSGSGAGDSTTTTGEGAGFLGAGGSIAMPDPVGDLTGTVLAPEGTIPISGALVYLTSNAPEAIPDGVYCDRCIELDVTIPFTESNADGTFVLPAYSTGTQFLVVQKGQFRRVRQFDVQNGTQAVTSDMTTLPGAMNKAAGDDIPKMAIAEGQWDDIGESLKKLGMQEGSFDHFEFSAGDVLNNQATLNGYHIVFTPCDSSDGIQCNSSPAQDSTAQANLAQFVDKGGKLYVTDYSYDYIRELWPSHIDWMGQTSAFGSACMPSSYDALATVQDDGMKAWLAAQGVTTFTLEANWTMIDKVNAVADTDLDGNNITVTPKVWVTGATPSDGDRPATLSFDRGCGRVLFSTYHTEGGGSGTLLEQEKALLYVLLEVGVCVGDPVIK